MDPTYFSRSKLTKTLENLQLVSDSILDVVKLYKTIHDAIKSSHTLAYSPLPHVNELTATIGILKLMLSRFDSRSYLYNKGQQFPAILGDALGGILKGPNIDKIFPRAKCPRSRMAINIVSDDSAWAILDSLTRAILPRCGAKTRLIRMVENLYIYGPSN